MYVLPCGQWMCYPWTRTRSWGVGEELKAMAWSPLWRGWPPQSLGGSPSSLLYLFKICILECEEGTFEAELPRRTKYYGWIVGSYCVVLYPVVACPIWCLGQGPLAPMQKRPWHHMRTCISPVAVGWIWPVPWSAGYFCYGGGNHLPEVEGCWLFL